MKKIIDGKLYNTKTADFLDEAHHSYPGQFDYWSEELYRTKKGAFFIYGKGGPMTRYSVSTGQNSWTGGEAIRVLDEDEVKEWLEDNGLTETYEDLFGVEEA